MGKFNLKPIEDQVVVVVGANSGIGRITALRFAERGAAVVVAGRSLAAQEGVVREISQKGGRSIPVQVDVTDFQQVQALAERAAQEFGRIDTWVHSAAVSMWAAFEDTSPDEFRRILEVNLLGQVYGAMAALPHLKREGRGALIHISSVEARRPMPLQSAYSASKGGMLGFLDSLRMEMEKDDLPISIVNVMPASIDTPLFDKAITRLGVKPRPIPPVYDPALVADVILYASEHPARDLYVGGAGKSLGLLQRLSPKLSDRTLEKMGFRLQKSDMPKSSSAPNNLYQHLEGYDTIHGSYRQEARPVSGYTWLQNRPALKWGLVMSLLATGVVLTARSKKLHLSAPIRIVRRGKRLPFNLDRFFHRSTLLERLVPYKIEFQKIELPSKLGG